MGKTRPSNLVSLQFSTWREPEHLQEQAAGRCGPVTALLCRGACSLLAGEGGSSPVPQHQQVQIHSCTRKTVFGSSGAHGCDVANGHLPASSKPAGLIFLHPRGCSVPGASPAEEKDLMFFSENSQALCHEPPHCCCPLWTSSVRCLRSSLSGGRRIPFLQASARAEARQKSRSWCRAKSETQGKREWTTYAYAKLDCPSSVHFCILQSFRGQTHVLIPRGWRFRLCSTA